MRWSRSSGWVTAEDRGIGIEQPGNTSSNFPARSNSEMNFPRIWRCAFLEEYRGKNEDVDKPCHGWRRHMEIGVNALTDFDTPGCIKAATLRSDGNGAWMAYAENRLHPAGHARPCDF